MRNCKPKPAVPSPSSLFPTLLVMFFVAAAAGGGLFWGIYTVFVPNPEISDSPRESLSEVAKTTVTALGALTVGGAAVIQYRKQRVLEFQAELDREAKHSEADARLSERLTKAIEHLGDDSITIRKGAIYELKRLAFDSGRDRPDIVEILSSFVREKIEALAHEYDSKPEDERGAKPKPENDVFIACNILRDIYNIAKAENCRAQLKNLFALNVNLEGIALRGANLILANFSGASIYNADLGFAGLFRADLHGARLHGADLSNAFLYRANLPGARLHGARLHSANLHGADLYGADLYGADLSNAFLYGADLRYSIDLTVEQLAKAQIDETTTLDPNLYRQIYGKEPPGRDG